MKLLATSKTVLSSPIFKVVAICIATCPIFLLLPLLIQNGVNIPLMDQWDTPTNALLKAANGTLSFSDLIAQHNESRKFFPRLVFLGMAFMTGWDVRYEFALIFLIACLIAYQIYRLSHITIRGSKLKRFFLTLLANLLIFSPAQSENLLWGIQLITFIPISCIATGLIVAYSSKIGTKLKTVILIGLCTVSTYSYANGMLSWFIMFPSAILIARLFFNQTLKSQRWLLVGGTLGCLANLVLYFYNYSKPPQTPSFSASLAHPFDAIRFFLIFLGSPLSMRQIGTAQLVGLVLVILFGYSCFYLFRHRKDQELLAHSIPWVAIGSYSCISGLMTTAGRFGFGLGAAMPSRYTTFSLYLSIALIYLLTIVIVHAFRQGDVQGTSKIRRIQGFLVLLVVSFLTLHTLTYFSHANIMARDHRHRLHAKACVLFINFVEEKSVIETTIYPIYDMVKPKINQLNQAHFLNPSLVESPNVLDLVGKQKSPSEFYGYLDPINQINEKEIMASGWAVLPYRNQPADAVILAYETSKGEMIPFHIAPILHRSPDVAQHLNNPAYRNVRWITTFEINKLPKTSVNVSAWAFDTDTKKAYRLANAGNTKVGI